MLTSSQRSSIKAGLRHRAAARKLSAARLQTKGLRFEWGATPALVRWTFLLFAFTLPFESIDLGVMPGLLSLAKISGYLFILVYIIYYNPFSQKRSLPGIPPAMWCFLGYIAIVMLNGFFLPENLLSQFSIRLLTLFQLVIFFWIATSLLQEEKLVDSTLLVYSVASVILASGIIFHFPGFSETVHQVGTGRLTALGQNPNVLAALMSLAAVINIGLYTRATSKGFLSKTLPIIMTLPLLVVMVMTGSRTAVGAFLIGCLIYLAPQWRATRSRWKIMPVFLGITGIVAMVYLVVNNPDFLERWYQVFYEGNLSGRTAIFGTSLDMFFERPIFGWRPVEFWYELGFRVGRWGVRGAHNLFSHLLLEVGIIGAIPFLAGLWICGLAAWRARKGYLGLLPLALLATLMACNMGGTWLTRKPFWLVLALASAAASAVVRQRYTLTSVTPEKHRSKDGALRRRFHRPHINRLDHTRKRSATHLD